VGLLCKLTTKGDPRITGIWNPTVLVFRVVTATTTCSVVDAPDGAPRNSATHPIHRLAEEPKGYSVDTSIRRVISNCRREPHTQRRRHREYSGGRRPRSPRLYPHKYTGSCSSRLNVPGGGVGSLKKLTVRKKSGKSQARPASLQRATQALLFHDGLENEREKRQGEGGYRTRTRKESDGDSEKGEDHPEESKTLRLWL